MSTRKQDRPLSARLDRLGAAFVAAKQRERGCELEHRRVAAEIAQLTDAIADAYADNDEARAAKASKQRAALEQGACARPRSGSRAPGAPLSAPTSSARRSLRRTSTG